MRTQTNSGEMTICSRDAAAVDVAAASRMPKSLAVAAVDVVVVVVVVVDFVVALR